MEIPDYTAEESLEFREEKGRKIFELESKAKKE